MYRAIVALYYYDKQRFHLNIYSLALYVQHIHLPNSFSNQALEVPLSNNVKEIESERLKSEGLKCEISSVKAHLEVYMYILRVCLCVSKALI